VVRKKGVYTGRLKGTTKGKPERARALKGQGLTIAEIANAMAVSKRTVFRYLSRKL
jgi:orotate phosphoribosyltransferase-like protein